MKLKIIYALLGIIMIVLVGLIINELVPKDNVNSSDETDVVAEEKEIPDVKKADRIEVINFHATQRCVSCTTLGKLSEKTITERFANEVASGKIIFKSVNVELRENTEIVNLYQASGSSLYINAVKDGKNNIVQNVKVWQYLSDEIAFTNYLETKLRSLL
jgi:uncharacterized membrane protein YraQ (UPF0718 family)